MAKYYTFGTLADGMEMPKDEWDRMLNHSVFPCGHIRPDVARKKFIIPVQKIDLSCAYNFVNAPRLSRCSFFRKDLFSVLEPYLIPEYDFGQISYQGQLVSEGYVLWAKSDPIRLRGLKEYAIFWRCKDCGQPNYDLALQSYTRKPLYALRQDVEGVNIREAEIDGGIIISEEVHRVLTTHPRWNTFKKNTKLKPLQVLEEPLDGLPKNLLDTPPEMERLPKWMTIPPDELDEELAEAYKEIDEAFGAPPPSQ